MSDATETNGYTAPVSTADEAVAYINRIGFCTWRRVPKWPGLPSLESQTPWDETGDAIMQMWFWKDDLHIDKKVFYGQLLGRDGVPVFASLEFLPYLIAAQGDCTDIRELYEKNRLSHVALALYEHIERNGPTPKNRLPYPPKTSQTPPLIALQQKFLITKTGLTGRTRGTYGYLWGVCETAFPDAFTRAAQITVTNARAHIVSHLQQNGLPNLTLAEAAKMFRWDGLS